MKKCVACITALLVALLAFGGMAVAIEDWSIEKTVDTEELTLDRGESATIEFTVVTVNDGSTETVQVVDPGLTLDGEEVWWGDQEGDTMSIGGFEFQMEPPFQGPMGPPTLEESSFAYEVLITNVEAAYESTFVLENNAFLTTGDEENQLEASAAVSIVTPAAPVEEEEATENDEAETVVDAVYEEDPLVVTLYVDSLEYEINEEANTMDVAPFIEDDRTFVPVSFIATAFGLEADWGPKEALTEWVTFENEDMLVEIEIGSPYITVTEGFVERTETADVAAQIVDDRTFLPLRAVGEIFGADFDWGPKDALTEWVSFTLE